jgi:hypothetical protein
MVATANAFTWQLQGLQPDVLMAGPEYQDNAILHSITNNLLPSITNNPVSIVLDLHACAASCSASHSFFLHRSPSAARRSPVPLFVNVPLMSSSLLPSLPFLSFHPSSCSSSAARRCPALHKFCPTVDSPCPYFQHMHFGANCIKNYLLERQYQYLDRI